MSNLKSQFLLWGGPGDYTHPFDELPDKARNSILGYAKLDGTEDPAIAYFLSGTEWTLLTTRRLIWRVGDSVGDLRYPSIDDVTPRIRYSRRSHADARAVPSLEITTREGTRCFVGLEGGSSFVAVWNILAMLASYPSDELRAHTAYG